MNRLYQCEERYSYLLDLGLLAAAAGVLRLWGIGFDLPNLYHRDEAKYVTIPLRILKTGDFNPQFFNYPSLFFYLLSMVYVTYFLFMASRGRLGSLDGLVLPEQVMPNVVGRAPMPSQFLVGRGAVALSGLLTVWLVYWAARRAYSRRAALLAGLMLTLSPTHIRNSHFVAPDVTMILLAVASFAFCLEVWQRGRRRDYLLAGLLAGLAVSTKYNAYPILVPLLVAHMLRPGSEARNHINIPLAGLACGLGFFAGTPYAILDLPSFLNGVAFELRHYATLGDPGIEGQNALLWYARYLLRSEGLLPLLGVLQAVRGALARSARGLLFLSFPIAYLFTVSFGAVKNDRTVLTIIPFLCILAGGLLDEALRAVQAWAAEASRPGLIALSSTAALILLTAAWPAWQAAQINVRFSQPDVRTQVTQWLEAQLPPGSRVVGEYYSPLLVDSALAFHWVDRAIDQPVEWYEQNADYVVFVENRYGGFYLDPPRYPKEIAAYEAMLSRFDRLQEFQGGALGLPCHAMIYGVKR